MCLKKGKEVVQKTGLSNHTGEEQSSLCSIFTLSTGRRERKGDAVGTGEAFQKVLWFLIWEMDYLLFCFSITPKCMLTFYIFIFNFKNSLTESSF